MFRCSPLRAVSLAVALLTALGSAGCAPGRDTPGSVSTGAGQVKPEYGKDGRLTRIDRDADGNGVIDTWGYMDGVRVLRVEVDEDGDGRVDRWEYHADSAPAPGSQDADNTIERIERATRHDGTVNRREFFERGVLARVEEDTDADGRIDKWETYRHGALATVAIDTQHRGTPDRRLIYADDGSFLRVEAEPAAAGSSTPR